MSGRKGDKARHYLQRLARLHQREKIRAMFADKPAPKGASEKKADADSD